jgi:hypothetical protein
MSEHSGAAGIPCPEIGMRAWYLSEARGLEAQLGFSTSNFVTLPWEVFDDALGSPGDRLDTATAVQMVDSTPLAKRGVHPDIVAHYADRVRPVVSSILTATAELDGNVIISRSSPFDEHARPDLSFAGVYKSSMPRHNGLTKEEALHIGTANVLAGRFTQYGNGYYERHGMHTDRHTGIMYMQPFYDVTKDAPLIHGTAYVAGGLIRNEYLIAPPPDRPQRDPRIMVRWGAETQLTAPDQSVEHDLDFAPRMTKVLDGLHAHFNAPLDVEYLLDTAGNMYVVQIRQISARHMANWIMSSQVTDEFTPQDSGIVNTVAAVEGHVIDLRHRDRRLDLQEAAQNGAVLVVSHEEKGPGMHTQKLLDTIREQRPTSGLQVVIEHEPERLRDHLQYAMVEDPHIQFALQTTDPKVTAELRDGAQVRIESNGLTASVTQA